MNYRFWRRGTSQPGQDQVQATKKIHIDHKAVKDCKEWAVGIEAEALPLRHRSNSRGRRPGDPPFFETATPVNITPATSKASVPSINGTASKSPVLLWRSLSTKFKSSHGLPSAPKRTALHGEDLHSGSGCSQLPDRRTPKLIEVSSGAAARAAAAAHKLERPCHPPGGRSRVDALQRDEIGLKKARMVGQSLTKDTESGIGIDLREERGDLLNPAIPVIRKGEYQGFYEATTRLNYSVDPFEVFPSEITSLILSSLDCASLASAELVSHQCTMSQVSD